MYRLDTVLLDPPHMIYWIIFHNKYAMLFSDVILVRGKTALTLNPIQGH